MDKVVRMSRVLVTGASRGIGRAIADRVARAGHELIATARDPETLTGLQAELALALDVTDEASVLSAVEQAGPVDVLVNNAGVAMRGPVEDAPVPAVADMFDINVFGVMRTTRAVLPRMRARGSGLVVNMSSVVGRVALPFAGPYAASKYALEALSEALALELTGTGVRVVVVQPGYVTSGGYEASPVFDSRDGHYSALQARIGPPQSASSPDDVAAAVLDAIDGRGQGLRVPVGEGAAALLGARQQLPDDEFDATLRQMLNVG